MQCPKCGYELQPFDESCPRCAQLAAQPGGPVPLRPPLLPPETKKRAVGKQQVIGAALWGRGAVTGALDAWGGFTFLLIDRYVLGGSESARLGLLVSVILAWLFGAVFGAIQGVATALFRSPVAGIVVGAALFGLTKAVVIGPVGLGKGWSVVGFVVALVYGAIFGAFVGFHVMERIKKAEEV